jgi:hypothetical protein
LGPKLQRLVVVKDQVSVARVLLLLAVPVQVGDFDVPDETPWFHSHTHRDGVGRDDIDAESAPYFNEPWQTKPD